MCAVRVTLCVSGIVRAVHQSSSKLGDTPLVRLDLFESLPSRRFGCRASTTNSTAKSRSTSLYNGGASSRGGCRAPQLYSAPERSTSLQLYSALHSTSSTPSLSLSFARGGASCSSLTCHFLLSVVWVVPLFVPLAPWSAGGGDREDVALSYVYADSGCVAASWLCVL